jgi:tRNA threonylcarbamoyladenosine biosynthesis protein TsaE
MAHPPDHIQPTANSHWSAYLEDAEATNRLGSRLAGCVAPGMRLYFRGELGSGKSTLIRGLLRGLGVRTRVKSPTYTLVEHYVVSRLHLYHFDFYRFLGAREFADAGLADYFEGDGVCLVEWPERAGELLPRPDLEFALAYSGAGREVRASAHSAAGERCLAACRDA